MLCVKIGNRVPKMEYVCQLLKRVCAKWWKIFLNIFVPGLKIIEKFEGGYFRIDTKLLWSSNLQKLHHFGNNFQIIKKLFSLQCMVEMCRSGLSEIVDRFWFLRTFNCQIHFKK